MLKQNDPARMGEAVCCLLGGDDIGHTATALGTEVLGRRFCIPSRRAALLAELIWASGGNGRSGGGA